MANDDEEVADILTAISVVAKRLSKNLREIIREGEKSNENEGLDDGTDREDP